MFARKQVNAAHKKPVAATRSLLGKPSPMSMLRAPYQMPTLPYRRPQQGRDLWIWDDVLPNPLEVRARCLAKSDWTYGFPYRDEGWPGMRAIPALLPEELAPIEAWVKKQTGCQHLWQQPTATGMTLNHNCVQLVGADEADARPHTDSRTNCRFAAVIYLTPELPPDCGTAFYRQRLAGAKLGGNFVPPPHANLQAALGTRFVPPGSFVEDLRVDYRFNRLVMYRADLIHSAIRYVGKTNDTKRMAAVFFWHGQ